jgi:outer membrane lipoprotein SlyB
MGRLELNLDCGSNQARERRFRPDSVHCGIISRRYEKDGIPVRANKRLSIAAGLIFLAGCAAHPDPIIDMQGVTDMERYERDWNDCEAYTEEIAIEKGVAKGATTGAVVGAMAGAIDGDAGEGAGYGAIYGGTRSGLHADREKQKVFKRCMRGRGYRVLN